LPIQEQLRLGSEVIEHLASIYQAKANCWLEDQENTYDPQDPVFSGDWLQGLVRQTQNLDLSELTAPVQRCPRKPKDFQRMEQESVVGEVPQANVLKMVDQVDLEAQKATAPAVAYKEHIQDWVTEIHHWFDQHPQPLPLRQLQQQLGWPLVQLWLSLLYQFSKLGLQMRLLPSGKPLCVYTPLLHHPDSKMCSSNLQN